MIKIPFLAAIVSSVLIMAGCTGNEQAQAIDATPDVSDTVWAVNVGGPAYQSSDGLSYEAENAVSGGKAGRIATVKGSQDGELYATYREGDIHVRRNIADGVYDVTFHFAEPAEVEGGDRIFNAFIGQRQVISSLDVMSSRDGKIRSALSVTVPDVEINDGVLEVRFAATAGAPILSALAVRNKVSRTANWKLTWSDEFDEAVLDKDKWGINIWPARKVNDEDQAYTPREKNLRIEKGKLVIEAHKEDYGDARYTSGRVHSAGKGDFLYGRIEVRAKLPRGKGSWPAIWMLPSDPYRYSTTCEPGEEWQGSSSCDAWPNSGEIDIMEHVGYEMGHVHATVHNEAYYWLKWEQRKGRILLDDVDQKFHVYALEWTPDRIDAFVDDTHYFTYVNEKTGWRAWPYDHAFHLILNVAVGGMWGRAGGGIDDTIFPQRMEVDYVRVYEANNGQQ